MARRRISKLRYFSGDTEIENVRWFAVGGAGEPVGQTTQSGPNGRFGTPVGASKVVDWSISHHLDSRSDWLPMEREIKYLTKPDPHQCDWRCMGATPNGECWCECGGKNHGRNFRCEAA